MMPATGLPLTAGGAFIAPVACPGFRDAEDDVPAASQAAWRHRPVIARYTTRAATCAAANPL